MNSTSTNFSANISTDPFYSFYKNFGVSGLLVSLHGLRWAIATIGLLMNAAFCYVTVKEKMWHRCNILLALTSFIMAIYLILPTAGFVVVSTGLNFIPLRLCYCFGALPLFCSNVANALMMAIGLDRFLSVVFPIWYKSQRGNNKYIYAIVALCFCRGIYYFFWYLYAANTFGDKMVMCSPGDTTVGPTADVINRDNLIWYSCLVGIYALVWVQIACTKNAASLQLKRRIMFSLSLIVGCITSGFLISGALRILLPLWVPDPMLRTYLGFISSILVTIINGSNPPILYATSAEYRKAFRRHIFERMVCNPPKKCMTTILVRQNNRNAIGDQQPPAATAAAGSRTVTVANTMRF